MNIENIPGYIEWLKSEKTSKEFPVFMTSADVDYVTNGICSASSITEKFIAIGMATDNEYNSGRYGLILFQDRMNKSLMRNDLRVIQAIRIDEQFIGH